MKISILLCSYGDETRAAMFEANTAKSSPLKPVSLANAPWTPVELGLESPAAVSLVGNIYLGSVVNVVPALEAVFVDIGLEKNAFLHVRETLSGKRVESQFKRGDKIMVQVIRDGIKTKGPRLSQQISLVGRSVVWLPDGNGVGVSKKFTQAQRDKYRKMLHDATDGGLIVRTAGLDFTKEDFLREIAYLQKIWAVVRRRQEAATGSSARLYTDVSLGISWLREIRSGELHTVMCDDPTMFAALQKFMNRVSPKEVSKLQLVDRSAWETSGAAAAWASVFEKTVYLPGGGSLVIEPTEALTVIDVNSGSSTNKKNLQDTILQTNLAAIDEIGRQIRLRDIGGLIVLDLIDMIRVKDKRKVEGNLEKILLRDRARWSISPISELGLVEMSRQNLAASVRDLSTQQCETCGGSGIQQSTGSLARELWRELWLQDTTDECVWVSAPAETIEWLSWGGGKRINAIEKDIGKQLVFSVGPLEVRASGSTADMFAAAAPLAVGDELWVKISQPHMYDDGDAVAHLGDYTITVRGAQSLIGQSVLLRVEELTPTHARAQLIVENTTNGQAALSVSS